ncbi:IclR family transcriptional regulator domain-containing protein [Humitalea sp. 24SJ18S-53]|uniref:IclR family transcriptional regulator domain-containing protein n=1 Tax=Humitalea sp. 24SJ18S-53 TaxID=3422307 RepID=UPI003D67E59B
MQIGRASVGKALLMIHGDAEVGRILRRANTEETNPDMRVSVAKVRADLKESRERGWTESRGAVLARSNTFAMPMPSMPNHPPLVIGIGTTVVESDQRRPDIVAALKAFCESIAFDIASQVYIADDGAVLLREWTEVVDQPIAAMRR